MAGEHVNLHHVGCCISSFIIFSKAPSSGSTMICRDSMDRGVYSHKVRQMSGSGMEWTSARSRCRRIQV